MGPIVVTPAASARSTSSPRSRTPATRSPSCWTPTGSTTRSCSGSRAGRTCRRRRSCCRRRRRRRLPAADLHAGRGAAVRRAPDARQLPRLARGRWHAEAARRVVQECGAGLVPRPADRRRARVRRPAVRARGPGRGGAARARSPASLGIEPRRDRRRRSGSTTVPAGSRVLLESADAVLAAAARRHRPGPRRRRAVPARVDAAVEVRAFFAVDGNEREDPVTGSLNAALADWLLASGRLAAPYMARQGTALGRRGRVGSATRRRDLGRRRRRDLRNG